MERARIIFCEQTGLWAAASARQCAAGDVEQRQTRSLAALEEELRASPTSLAAVELTAHGAKEALDWIISAAARFPYARVAVLVAREAAALGDLALEAGAVQVFVSPRDLAPLVELARRHARLAPREKKRLAERVWAELPWSPVSTTATRVS